MTTVHLTSALLATSLIFTGRTWEHTKKKDLGKIDGFVVDGTTGARLPEVSVRAVSSVESFVVASNQRGEYQFNELGTRNYSLVASKEGYTTAEFGSIVAGGPGVLIRLPSSGSLPALELKLFRGAVLSGTVRSQDGRPLIGAAVYAFPKDELGVLDKPIAGQTDEQGRYRLFDLPSGDFMLAVSTSRSGFAVVSPGRTSPRPTGQAPVYYPATSDIREAVAIHLNPGDDRSGTDIVFASRPLVNVRGSVAGLDTRQGASIELTPVGVDRPLMEVFGSPWLITTSGYFSFLDVPPARYALTVLGDDNSGWSQRTLDIGPNGVEELAVSLERLILVSCRLSGHIDGGAPDLSLFPLSVATDSPGDVTVISRFARSRPLTASYRGEGLFQFSHVIPGAYRITVADGTKDWVIRSVWIDGRPAESPMVDLRTSSELLIDLDDSRDPVLSGRLKVPIYISPSSYQVVLFQEDRSGTIDTVRWTSAVTDDGRYRFGLVPEGSYWLAAIPTGGRSPSSIARVQMLRALHNTAVQVQLQKTAVVRDLAAPLPSLRTPQLPIIDVRRLGRY